MNRTDVAKVWGEMTAIWKVFDPTKESLKAWSDTLGDSDVQLVLLAVQSYAKTGSEFPPNPYQILGRLPKKRSPSEVSSDPEYCRKYLEGELKKGFVVVGHEHPAGFAWRFKEKRPYFEWAGKRILHGITVDIWRD